MFELVWTPQFTRQARKFQRAHPELRERFIQVLNDLEVDPYQPHLRLHRLQGGMRTQHAVSVTHSYRVTLTLLVTEREIILLDIGSHDEVYR